MAILVDLLRVGSGFRAGIRKLRDKWAEKSVQRLRARIASRQKYRDETAKYLTSERALYLATWKLVFGVLACLCVGVFCAMTIDVPHPDAPGGELLPPVRLFGMLSLTIGILLAWAGMRMTALESAAEVKELLDKLDAEIAAMEAKLEARIL